MCHKCGIGGVASGSTMLSCSWCAACGEAAGLDQSERQAGVCLNKGRGSCQHSLCLTVDCSHNGMCAVAATSCCSLLSCHATPNCSLLTARWMVCCPGGLSLMCCWRSCGSRCFSHSAKRWVGHGGCHVGHTAQEGGWVCECHVGGFANSSSARGGSGQGCGLAVCQSGVGELHYCAQAGGWVGGSNLAAACQGWVLF